jgi:hypothetical protein
MATPSSDKPDEPATLLALTSQPDYSGRVSEVVQQVPCAADEAEAVGLLAEAAHRMGAEVAAFVTLFAMTARMSPTASCWPATPSGATSMRSLPGRPMTRGCSTR